MGAQRGVKLKDHTVLALDIGSRFIKVVEVRLMKGAISLLNVAVGPTPAGVKNNSQILDPVTLGRAIRELLVANKIKSRKVIVAVSGQSSVVVRPIDLPRMTRKELTDTMKFEVERHIPFAVDEIIMDYAPFVEPELVPEEDATMKVLLAVAQEELVSAYLMVLKKAGLQPVALDVEILSVIRSLIDVDLRLNSGAYDQTLGLINIGAASTDISIVDRGNLAFTRSVPIAGDALTEAIADQMGRGFDEAEEMKREHGRIFLDSAVGELPSPAGEETTAPMDDFSLESQPTPFFSGFDAPEETADSGPTLGEAGVIPKNIFSLDEDFDTSGPLVLGPTDASTPVAAPEPAPAANAAEVDSTEDSEAPVFKLDLDEEPAAQPAAPAMEEAPAETADAGPVFDLTSELAGELTNVQSRYASSDTFGDAQEGEEAPAPAAEAISSEDDDLYASLSTELDEHPALAITPKPAEGGEALQATAFVPTTELDATTAFERPDTPQNDIFQRRVFESMLPVLLELTTEIRRSLEYYSTREPDRPVERLIIYGGTSRLPRLAEFIHQEIGLDVQNADPIQVLDLTTFRQPVEYLRDLAPALPVAIGLGLRDMLA